MLTLFKYNDIRVLNRETPIRTHVGEDEKKLKDRIGGT